MNNIIDFPVIAIKGEALTIDDNFNIDQNRDFLVDWLLSIKTKSDADAFITALYNEGVLVGDTLGGKGNLILSRG